MPTLTESVQLFNQLSHKYCVRNTFVPSLHGDCFRVLELRYSEEPRPSLILRYRSFNERQFLYVFPSRLTGYISRRLLLRLVRGVRDRCVYVTFYESGDCVRVYLTVRGVGLHKCICAPLMTCVWREHWCMDRWNKTR